VKPLISLNNVSLRLKKHRSFRAELFDILNNISFDVYNGESIGIIGRNGAGKSTLLKLIAGILEPDEGIIKHGNLRISLFSLQAGFENELNAVDNIFLSGILLGFSIKEIKSKLDVIIEYSGLANYTGQPLKTYSTGMKARLGFAIGYQLKTDVLLIDEILGVGDMEFKIKSRKAMTEKIKSDQTVILVSHDLNLIQETCSRIFWLENGKIKTESEDVEQTLTDYKNSLKNVQSL
jgi:lipopolysaccharide transport system ATP-binding protein